MHYLNCDLTGAKEVTGKYENITLISISLSLLFALGYIA